MKKILIGLFSLMACVCVQAHNLEITSQAIGHDLAEAIIDNGIIDIDMNLYIKGLKSYVAADPFPNVLRDKKLDIENHADLKRVSELLGYLCGQLVDIIFTCDHKHLIKGIEAHIAGDESPLNEDESEKAALMIAHKAPVAFVENIVKLFEALTPDDE